MGAMDALTYEAELMWVEARGTPREEQAWRFWQAMAAIGRQVSRGQVDKHDTPTPAHRDGGARSGDGFDVVVLRLDLDRPPKVGRD